ncbi:MAG TPA: hypothetical protein PLP19_12310 [bacterium]|nr:hypothetical protein [bacterium]HPN44267.1 hypothetical protein [bacterium]
MSNFFYSALMWGMGLFFLGLLGYGFYIVLTSKDDTNKKETVAKKTSKKVVKSN